MPCHAPRPSSALRLAQLLNDGRTSQEAYIACPVGCIRLPEWLTCCSCVESVDSRVVVAPPLAAPARAPERFCFLSGATQYDHGFVVVQRHGSHQGCLASAPWTTVHAGYGRRALMKLGSRGISLYRSIEHGALSSLTRAPCSRELSCVWALFSAARRAC